MRILAQNIRSQRNVWIWTWRVRLHIYRHVSCNVNLITLTSHTILRFLSQDLRSMMMKMELIARTIQYPRIESLPHCTIQDCYLGCRQLQFPQKTGPITIPIFVSCRNQCRSFSQYMRCMTKFITRRCFAEERNIYIYLYIYVIEKKRKQINKVEKRYKKNL